MITFVLLGIAAGILTTWAGLGGGLFLTLALSLLFGPKIALATAAPALWLGNAHRAFLFRRFIDRGVYVWIGAAALVGAFVGGMVAVALPARVLQVLVVVATVVALIPGSRRATAFGGRVVSVPLGLLAGFATATSGAGGVFIVPAVLGMGLDGARFMATMAVIAMTMHTGRIAAYAAGGWVTAEILGIAATLGVSIMAGNFVGRWLRHRTPERVLGWALRGMTTALALMALISLA